MIYFWGGKQIKKYVDLFVIGQTVLHLPSKMFPFLIFGRDSSSEKIIWMVPMMSFSSTMSGSTSLEMIWTSPFFFLMKEE